MGARESTGADMARFWDERARENALFFIDNRLAYAAPDAKRFWAEGERDLDRLLQALGVEIEPGMVVVDVGCGVGRLTRPLSARAHRVVAIDVSEEMVARARQLNPQLSNVRWLVGDGISLAPVPDASVDACVSHVVFQHIPEPDVILGYVREMGRVLRPRGWAAFQVSNDPQIHERRRRSARSAIRVLLGRGPRAQNDPRWRGAPVDLDALGAAAAEAHLALERVKDPGTQFCLVLARRQSDP